MGPAPGVGRSPHTGGGGTGLPLYPWHPEAVAARYTAGTMSLNSRFEEPEPSFDAETAARALGLAARLQEERDARIGVEELFRTAAEAGIAPDLLEEALQQVELPEMRVKATVKRVSTAGLATGWLTLISLVYVVLHALGATVASEGPYKLFWWAAVFAAFLVTLLNPREGRKRFWGPALVLGTWFGFLVCEETLRMNGTRLFSNPDLGPYLILGLFQFLFYVLATGARAWAEGRREGAGERRTSSAV